MGRDRRYKYEEQLFVTRLAYTVRLMWPTVLVGRQVMKLINELLNLDTVRQVFEMTIYNYVS